MRHEMRRREVDRRNRFPSESRLPPSDRRGWVAAATAIATPLIGQVMQATNKKDAARFATIQAWYSQAIANDVVALCALKHMGGRRGAGHCGGSQMSGFATKEAKDYCEQMYQQAEAVLSGQLSPGAPVPLPTPGPTTGQTIQTTAGQAGTTLNTIAGAGGGKPPTPTAEQQQGLAVKWGMIAGGIAVVALVAYVLVKRR